MDAQRVQLSCTPSAGKEKNKAIQHTFQVPKQWSAWGDTPYLGCRLYLPGEGGGHGTTINI